MYKTDAEARGQQMSDGQRLQNALFYKTEHGACIGDLYMSIIHTCALAGVNAFEYLNALEEHSKELFRYPGRWLPWSYREQLAAAVDQPD